LYQVIPKGQLFINQIDLPGPFIPQQLLTGHYLKYGPGNYGHRFDIGWTAQKSLDAMQEPGLFSIYLYNVV
jgi:hypothetical protein